MKKMTTKAIGMIVMVAGLMCSCQQQQNPETQAEYDEYQTGGDSLYALKRLQKWEAYVEEHPKDEMGWRNLYNAKELFFWWDRKNKNYDQMKKDREELMQRVKDAIPDTYTYYLLAKETTHEYNKIKKYAEEALKRLPENLNEDDYKTWCTYLLNEDDGKRLKDMLTRYYKSGLLSPEILYYHYNEMQGMEEGGIYLGEWEGDLIPKKMIQMVMGMHKDKVLVNRNGDWYKVWRACKIPGPAENWAETTPMDTVNPGNYWNIQTLKMLAWIGEHSEHPVYFSTSNLSNHRRETLPKELLKNLYNEGLLLRYSPKPYDNIAVTCRNIEERYSLDYLYLPFTPSKDSKEREHQYSEADDCSRETVVLLQSILPHYQQYDPQRCHWLSGLLLKAIECRKDFHNRFFFIEMDVEEIREYYEATKSAAQ